MLETLQLDKIHYGIQTDVRALTIATLRLEFDCLPPTLNGSSGLQRMHFRPLMNVKHAWLLRVIAQRDSLGIPLGMRVGACRIGYQFFHNRWMDHENYIAGFKVIGDALVQAKILVDDSPLVIVAFYPQFFKTVHNTDRGVAINIEVIRWAQED